MVLTLGGTDTHEVVYPRNPPLAQPIYERCGTAIMITEIRESLRGREP
jgi:hypothetical protein